jgi:hypothetical protein
MIMGTERWWQFDWWRETEALSSIVALSTNNLWNRTRASPVRSPRLTSWPMIHAFIKHVNVTVILCIRIRQYLIWISTEFPTWYYAACRDLLRSLKNVFRPVSTALLQFSNAHTWLSHIRLTERYSKHRHVWRVVGEDIPLCHVHVQ